MTTLTTRVASLIAACAIFAMFALPTVNQAAQIVA